MDKSSHFISFQGWKFNHVSGEIIGNDGKLIELSPTDSRVLKCLADRPGQILSRDEILDQAWDEAVQPNSVDQAIGRIREALETFGFGPEEVIKTARRRGYKFILSPLLIDAPDTAITADPEGKTPPPRRRQFAFWLLVSLAFSVVLTTGWFLSRRLSLASSTTQAQLAKTQEQFNIALTRLNSQNSRERVAGVGTLAVLLADKSPEFHRPVLNALTDALAVEDDTVARGAILDVFRQLDPKLVGQEVLNETLQRAVSRNRSIVRGDQVGKLDFQKLPYADVPASKFPYFGGQQTPRLEALKYEILQLLREGASVHDFSEIYCDECDFSGLVLDKVIFDRALLWGANFWQASLVEASFQNSWLLGADFTRANLTRARFASTGGYDPWLLMFSHYGSIDNRPFNFTCADLTGADFTDFPIAYSIGRDQKKERTPVESLVLSHAKVDGTDFRLSYVLAITWIVTKDFPNRTWKTAQGHDIEEKLTKMGNFPQPDVKKAVIESFAQELNFSDAPTAARLPQWIYAYLEKGVRSDQTSYCADLRQEGP